MQEPNYSLKRSAEKVGMLVPCLVDEAGNIIDGRQRKLANPNWPTVTIPTKSKVQNTIIDLTVNFCRRTAYADEMKQKLAYIAEHTQWTPKQIAEALGFSYTTVMRYLPNQYKLRPGVGGPKPKTKPEPVVTVKTLEASEGPVATERQNMQVQTQPCPPTAPSQGEVPPRAEEPVKQIVKPAETEEQFGIRFTKTFSQHVKTVIEKDFPVIVNHMDENKNCAECVMRNACELLLNLFELQKQLPVCMQERFKKPR